MKMTSKERIYAYLKTLEGREFSHRKIIDSAPMGLGISEYSGRFSDLRKDFGCTCGEDPTTCTATEHILNTRKNFYKYISGAPKAERTYEYREMPTESDVKAKLNDLRAKYRDIQEKLATANGIMKVNLERDLQIITIQGKALKRAMPTGFVRDVQEALI